jgi:hypothetical protein
MSVFVKYNSMSRDTQIEYVHLQIQSIYNYIKFCRHRASSFRNVDTLSLYNLPSKGIYS